MSHYLLDTGVLIRHLRGQRRTVRSLRALGKLDRLAVTSITRLELHAGMLPDERFATQKLLARFVCLDLDRETADRAGDLVRESRVRGKLLGVPDAIIAATAMRHGMTVVTFNLDDFADVPGLSLISPTEDSEETA